MTGRDASSAPANRSSLALGAVLGLAAGLFFDAALTVLLGGAVLTYFVVFTLGLVYIAPVVIGVRKGLRVARDGRLPRLSAWAVVAAALVALPGSALAPFGARALHLRIAAAREIPLPAGTTVAGRSLKLLADDRSGPHVALTLEFPPGEDPLGYYESELTRRGWRPSENLSDASWGGTPHWWERRSSFFSLKLEGDQGDRARAEATYAP